MLQQWQSIILMMYSLAWENAMQRKLNAAVENATE
jgi:hypothetical protein